MSQPGLVVPGCPLTLPDLILSISAFFIIYGVMREYIVKTR